MSLGYKRKSSQSTKLLIIPLIFLIGLTLPHFGINIYPKLQFNKYTDSNSNLLEICDSIPLLFIENRGQLDEKVRYYAKMGGQTTYLTDEGLVFDLVRPVSNNTIVSIIDNYFGTEKAPPEMESLVYSLNFVDASTNTVKINGLKQNQAKFNYFIGNNPNKWYTDISSYSEVVYESIYPNIDLKLYSKNSSLAYDFIVNPGGKVDDIKLAYSGIDRLFNENNKLVAHTKLGNVEHASLNIYQEVSGQRLPVDGGFTIIDDNTYSFQVASYNVEQPLIIDPTLSYSTFLGGSQAEYAYSSTLDTTGNVYIAGFTNSTNFPTTPGAYDISFNSGGWDAFVTKLNPTGTALIYSTFLGGSQSKTGNGDYAHGITIDASGNAYVSGMTDCSDFPTTAGAFDTSYNGGNFDAFVTKLNPTGTALVYSTFLGGSQDDEVKGIAVDTTGNAFVAGDTRSANFPTTPNAYDASYSGWIMGDAFVTKLNPTGTALVYSTFLGGSQSGASFNVNCIAIDASGNAYVTGMTGSYNGYSDFPTTPGAYNANGYTGHIFVTKLNSAGAALIYSTFLNSNRGPHSEESWGIAVDTSGNAYVSGLTSSTDFPATPGAYDTTYNGGAYDVFVAKLNPTGASLVYCTYIGGSAYDNVGCIAIDTSGNAYITGGTGSADFPTTPGAYDTSFNGGSWNVYVAKLNSTGTALSYSTFLGGSGSQASMGRGINVDTSGNIYVTGITSDTEFPTTVGAYDTSYNGSYYDAFVAKFASIIPQVVTADANNITANSARLNGTLLSLGTSNNATVCFTLGTVSGVYPNETPVQVRSSIGTFSNNVTSLNPATTYFFRAKAVGDGTSYGTEKSFTTSGIIPPTPVVITLPPPPAPVPPSAPSMPERFVTSAANMIVTNLNVQPQQAQAKQPVTIYANIANRGDEFGSYTAILKINGIVEETRKGKLGGRTAVPLQFIVSKDKPGSYSVDINGQQTSFIIMWEDKNTDSSKTIPLIGFFLSAVGVVVVAAILIRRWRAT